MFLKKSIFKNIKHCLIHHHLSLIIETLKSILLFSCSVLKIYSSFSFLNFPHFISYSNLFFLLFFWRIFQSLWIFFLVLETLQVSFNFSIQKKNSSLLQVLFRDFRGLILTVSWLILKNLVEKTFIQFDLFASSRSSKLLNCKNQRNSEY